MKLRKIAKGQQCQVRIEGVCNFNNETTVLAHVYVKGMKGIGMKSNDLFGAWCCSSCHDAIDGRVKTEFTREQLQLRALEGVIRTQEALIEMSVIKC